METAAHEMSKSVTLITVLEESFGKAENQMTREAFEHDKKRFINLRGETSSSL
jgi:hypothetical protein